MHPKLNFYLRSFREKGKLLLKDEDGQLTNSDRDKAEVFKVFFTSVVIMDDKPRGFQCPELEDHGCKNDWLPFEHEHVWDLLLQLNHYKSVRPDGFHLRILKMLADIIAKPGDFEAVLASGEVLVDWKLVNVSPIFMKNKKEGLENYRPVILTSVPGKILEKIILGGIQKHLENNAIISHRQ
ncbi:hypothetical protein WISP_35636 [Willisornis vidua]|uniref:Uncharacterized protein n=1 Tax=Willisornis vidua TaxID=1566151 RepID=A0ABQ9DJB6_9PASS|nr:hypothetical protein WISP_35636 [Willisornis vidua]